MLIKCTECGRVLTAPCGGASAQGTCPHCQATVDLARAERVGLSPGDVVGDVHIEAVIGRGGMATVYRGTQTSLDRTVAVKVLAPALARRRQFVQRFQREAHVLGQLSHPNIVRILGVGTHEGLYYLAMEYVDGESLRERLTREGRLPLQEAVRLIGQVAEGLAFAHSQGILHRDIKPGNILLMADGTPKIVDFGIARITGSDSVIAQRLTMTSTQMGSAHYMAPEQMKDAANVDGRADVYALGVLLYETLTGELPIGQFQPASKIAPGVPRSVDRVIRTALAPSPDRRFRDLESFQSALARAVVVAAPTRVREPSPYARRAARSRSPVVPIAIGAGALVIALIVALAILTGGRRDERAGARRVPTSTPAATVAPTAAQQREQAARALYDQAAGHAARRQWRSAQRALDRLDRDLARTAFYAAHRAPLNTLRKQVSTGLRQKPLTGTAPTSPPPKPPEPAPAPPKPHTATPVRPDAEADTPLHGDLRLLPDGRIELRYDWSDAEQLKDWIPGKGGELRILDGELRCGGEAASSAVHAATFTGDIELAATWRILEGDNPTGSCGLYLCRDAGRVYAADLRLLSQRVLKRPQDASLAWSKTPCERGKPQSSRFVRSGDSLTVWINGQREIDAADPDFKGGGVAVGSYLVIGGFRDVRIVGTLAPAWLAAHPGAERQIDELEALAAKERATADVQKLYAEAVGRLRPLWAKRQMAEGLAAAKALAGEAPLAGTGAAAWVLEDAEALAELWKAVEAGAAKLEPGEEVRVGGVQGRVEKVEGGAITVTQGPVAFAKKLTGLRTDELVALAGRGRELDSGRDHLALALLSLHTGKPDREAVEDELALAAEAGLDVTRHRALLDTLVPAPTPKPKPTAPVKPEEPKEPKRERRGPIVLSIKLRLDGVSDLVVTPAGLHWEHHQWVRPGKATVNGKEWRPEWTGDTSSVFPISPFPRSLAGLGCKVTKVEGRGRVSVKRKTASRFVIGFSDPSPGADDYEARIVIAPDRWFRGR